MSFTVIIPARYASTRLPAKPLVDIGGKPMIQHVWERAVESGAVRTLIATDDLRIKSACEAFGAEAEMTDSSRRSGTERIAELAARRGLEDEAVVVNVQGDEPFIPSSLICQVAENLTRHADAADAATLCEPIEDGEAVFDPDVVKVVFDEAGFALYFSRAPIPWDRDSFAKPPVNVVTPHRYFRHIGIYAYRAGYLQTYVSLPASDAEQVERLEQLRILHHGGRIHVAEAADKPGPGVDSQADLDRLRGLISVRGC